MTSNQKGEEEKMPAPRKRDGSKFSLEESKNIVKKGDRLMRALEDLMPLVYEDGKIVGVQVSEGDSGELIKLGDSLEELTDLMDLRPKENDTKPEKGGSGNGS
jgi:hypothetical protein